MCVSIFYVKNVYEVLPAVPFPPDSLLVFQVFKTDIIFLQLSEGILAPWHSALFICNNIVKCVLLHVRHAKLFPCSFKEYCINIPAKFVGAALWHRG